MIVTEPMSKEPSLNLLPEASHTNIKYQAGVHFPGLDRRVYIINAMLIYIYIMNIARCKDRIGSFLITQLDNVEKKSAGSHGGHPSNCKTAYATAGK